MCIRMCSDIIVIFSASNRTEQIHSIHECGNYKYLPIFKIIICGYSVPMVVFMGHLEGISHNAFKYIYSINWVVTIHLWSVENQEISEFWKYPQRISDWLNEWMNEFNKGVCKTTPATPGLLTSTSISNVFFFSSLYCT